MALGDEAARVACSIAGLCQSLRARRQGSAEAIGGDDKTDPHDRQQALGEGVDIDDAVMGIERAQGVERPILEAELAAWRFHVA